MSPRYAIKPKTGRVMLTPTATTLSVLSHEPHDVPCWECGLHFTTTGTNTRYCSPRCKYVARRTREANASRNPRRKETT